MIEILLVDDNPRKISKICEVIQKFPEIDNSNIITCSDIITARRYLKEQQFDLMILDLLLPERFGDNAKKDGGLDLLYEINISQYIFKPFHIIGMTAYDELIDEFTDKFREQLWLIIKYAEENIEWEDQLNQKIKYLLQSKRTLKQNENNEFDFDIGIITALPDVELKSVLNLNADWVKYTYPNDSTIYHQGVFKNDNKRKKIVVASTHQMGMTAASVLTMKIITLFKPRYITIVGIAAGIKEIAEIGDILIADQSWDYGSGKITKIENDEVEFQADPKCITLENVLKEKFIDCKRERKFIDDIKNRWPGEKPLNSTQILLGPFASGAAVINH